MKLNTLKTSAASNGGSIRYRLYKNNNSGMSSSGAESAAKFSVVKNIKGIKILFRPSGVLREVVSMAKLTEMKQYEEPEA